MVNATVCVQVRFRIVARAVLVMIELVGIIVIIAIIVLLAMLDIIGMIARLVVIVIMVLCSSLRVILRSVHYLC